MGEWVQSGWEKLQMNQPIWETDSARAAAAVFLLQTGFFVTCPLAFTFIPQCNCKPHSNNSLISVISVSIQLKRQCKQESPLALPFSTFSIIPPYHFYPLFPPPLHSLSSSISLFSTLLHWSPTLNWFWYYCHSLPPIPSPLLFLASWLTGDNFQYHNQLKTRVNIDHRSLKVVVRVSEHIHADTSQGGVIAESSFLLLNMSRAWWSTCLGARRPPCVLKLTRPLILALLYHAFP